MNGHGDDFFSDSWRRIRANLGFLGRISGRFGRLPESGLIPRKDTEIPTHAALTTFPPKGSARPPPPRSELRVVFEIPDANLFV